jgi:hypothetical protein
MRGAGADRIGSGRREVTRPVTKRDADRQILPTGGVLVGREMATSIRRAAVVLLVLGALCSACDSGSFSGPVAATCTEIGSRCQLPDGPLGVCQEIPCAGDAKRPCFKCTSQH